MDKTTLKYDLNALKVLALLLEKGSVKASAEQLCISSSSVSKTLGRLRLHFNDPLFVRTAKGLVPTERAKELEPFVNQIFEIMPNCLSDHSFDPSTVNCIVRIASPEQFSLAFINKLLVHIKKTAPNITWESHQLEENYLKKLSDGSLDFAVSVENSPPTEFKSNQIYSSKLVYWSRKNHPLCNKKLPSLEDFFAFPQIAFRSQNIPFIENERIKKKLNSIVNRKLTPYLDTNHLMTGLDVLLKTDSLMLAPNYLAKFPIVNKLFLKYDLDHILEFDQLRINLSLVQHERTINSPLHCWIYKEMSTIFSSL